MHWTFCLWTLRAQGVVVLYDTLGVWSPEYESGVPPNHLHMQVRERLRRSNEIQPPKIIFSYICKLLVGKVSEYDILLIAD